MNPIELYPDSSTDSPVESARKAFDSTDTPADDNDELLTDSLGGSPSEEAYGFLAQFVPQMQLPNADDGHDAGEHDADGTTCPDCQRVGEEFRNFLLALNEPGAALAFNDEDADA